MSNEIETSVVPATGTQIAKGSDIQPTFPVVDLDTATELPNLEDAEVMPLELSSEYWEPGVEGEVKKVVFSHIEDASMPKRDAPGEFALVPTAFFYEQRDGSIVLIRQASKMLVASIQNNAVRRGTPMQIIYTGKKKFKNGNMGDTWSVKPLLIKTPVAV